jgi:ADP-heptose:LPS heptosyltransferase
VVFGGPEDCATGEELLNRWQRGYNAAGALDVRTAALALKQCTVYVGNDTGTMHLASAVGVPCVAIFSSREWPGLWHPHGKNNHVFRAAIECEGCGLVDCVQRKNECLRTTQVDKVVDAAAEIFNERAISCPA